jgi:predicted nucleic acid-binding protein
MARGGAGVNPYFIDTGAFFAALDPRDPHHAHAVGVFRESARAGAFGLTAKWTVVETHALLLARIGRAAALRWVSSIPCRVLPVEPEDEEAALRLLARHRDKDFTLVDAVSFVLMEKLGVRHYHSYDRHFRQYGRFIAVDPQTFSAN